MTLISQLNNLFQFNTELTIKQIGDVLKKDIGAIQHIVHLATADVETLSDEKLFGPAPRDKSYNDLSVDEKIQKTHQYGMWMGAMQASYGYYAARVMDINGLEPELNVVLYILGIEYKIGVEELEDGVRLFIQMSDDGETHTIETNLNGVNMPRRSFKPV